MAYKKPLKKDNSPKIICQNKECSKMGKHQSTNDFYKSRSSAMPNHPFCKVCVNEMIDIDNMKTVYDVLKVLDTPFIMDVWNEICLSGTRNYLGDYLKTMNFTRKNTYKGLRWVDSIFNLSDDQSDVSEEVQKEIDEIPQWNEEWQGKYSKRELEFLNSELSNLERDYKMSGSNHKDYAKKMCQASLLVNKTFQDVLDGKDKADVAYEKATKVFDALSKSGKFAESTRSSNDVTLGSFGRVFEIVEQHNWVPTYKPIEEDMYDKLLKQFANIGKSL